MVHRRSLLGPSLFSLAMFLLFLGLGTWQVQRLHWKEGLIAMRAAAVSAPPAALPLTLGDARPLEFHRVAVKGVFQHGAELYLHAISKDGAPGYAVLTPLLMLDGSFILINRGFVPEDQKTPASRNASQLQGEVTVTGLLRVPPAAKPSVFTPENDPARNAWYFVDLAAMAQATHIENLLPFYIDADATPNPGGYPLGGQTNVDLPNDHLQYALTWYGLAALMPILYLLLIRRIRRDRRESSDESQPL